jgi:hypothetical protein
MEWRRDGAAKANIGMPTPGFGAKFTFLDGRIFHSLKTRKRLAALF